MPDDNNKPATRPRKHPVQPSLSVKCGAWFEAAATGWGIAAVPVILLVLLAAAVLTRA